MNLITRKDKYFCSSIFGLSKVKKLISILNFELVVEPLNRFFSHSDIRIVEELETTADRKNFIRKIQIS